MNKNPLEKAIEKAVCSYAKTEHKILDYKFTSPARRSVPDRIFFPPKHPAFLIEFKRKGEKPTAAQQVEIDRIRRQGTRVYVVDNIPDGKRVIDWEMKTEYKEVDFNIDNY